MPPGGRSTGTRAAATHANANVPDENTEINLPMSELSLGDPSTATGGVDGGQLGTDGVVLKLLLPERETGHVIGKGGSVLTKIKLDSGARVRISNIDEVIPMTRERVCTIVGTLPAVLLAQKLVCNALVENARPPMDVVRPIARASTCTSTSASTSALPRAQAEPVSPSLPRRRPRASDRSSCSSRTRRSAASSAREARSSSR